MDKPWTLPGLSPAERARIAREAVCKFLLGVGDVDITSDASAGKIILEAIEAAL